MREMLKRVMAERHGGLRRRVIGLYIVLIAANIGAWAWALLAFRAHPVLLGMALLAYSFGLRHAVDADHIAAIDNVTRKLMQAGQRPVTVGFYFSLGHSSIVVLASVLIAATARAFKARFDLLQSVGAVVGTLVSAAFLLAIAAINFAILVSLWRAFRRVRAGERPDETALQGILDGRGLLARLLRPVMGLVGRSWHMYPVGILFGLGFDTATEIGLLGLSASQAAQGLPIWSILVFPALFTAGMSLVDTSDGILMLAAYGWAFIRPVRKLYYNMTLTLVSVLVAVLVGGIEALGLVGDRLALTGPFWRGVGALNDHFGLIGYLIIGLFAASWLVSMAIYRLRGYDRLDAVGEVSPR
jgi:high-affinity nickel-transport protein